MIILRSSTAQTVNECDSLQIVSGLELLDLGKAYDPVANIVPSVLSHGIADQGGTTSVRRINQENLVWKRQGYYQRKRDLGQSFTIPLDTLLKTESSGASHCHKLIIK